MSMKLIPGLPNLEANEKIINLIKIVSKANPEWSFVDILESLDLDSTMYNDRSEISLFNAEQAIKKKYESKAKS